MSRKFHSFSFRVATRWGPFPLAYKRSEYFVLSWPTSAQIAVLLIGLPELSPYQAIAFKSPSRLARLFARAAYSHSASLGSRSCSPPPPAHPQYAWASSHVTATPGRSEERRVGDEWACWRR